MRIACIQHVPFEGPGNIEVWATEHSHAFQIIRLYDGESLPEIDSFDLLVVMGGPMSVHDEAEYAWLRPEKALVARSIEQRKFVLGICLGSQLLAEVFGSPVYPNKMKEIGWFPVRLREAEMGSSLLFGVPATLNVLHWHGETYNLPPGCAHLAESEGCTVQAFEHLSALGLQFHLEATREGLAALIRHCGSEIGRGAYEQPPEAIAAGEITHGAAAKAAIYTVLDNISRRVAGFLQ